MSFDNLARSCLHNWLGYGNLNAPIWFMGMEEGGAEIWSKKTKTLEESLHIRSNFDLAMDFRTVWEDSYGIPLQAFRRRGLTVWHFMAVFMMAWNNQDVNSSSIRDYVFESKRLGRADSDHFMCEFLPLPRESHSLIHPYESIWSSVRQYKDEVTPKRFELIRQTLYTTKAVKLLVSYDKSFTELFLSHFPSRLVDDWQDDKGKTYFVYASTYNSDRKILLLSTPFFGNGQANYDRLASAAVRARKQI